MENKKLQIQGFVFSQNHLNKIRSIANNKETKLTASSLAMYVAYHSEVSTAGLIDADITVSYFARKIGIATSTAYDAHKQLIELGLVQITNKQIEIVGYAQERLTKRERRNQSGGLNYFYVPHKIFETTILAQLVHSYQMRAIILLLEQSNEFTRSFRNARNVSSVKDELNLSTLKQKLNLPSAVRVRKVLDILEPLFVFTPDKLKIFSTSVVKQLWVKKYNVHINADCVVEKDNDVDTDVLTALKYAEDHIKKINIPLFTKDRTGIHKAFRSMVHEFAKFIKDKQLKSTVIRSTMISALINLENYVKRYPGELKSLGAYMNDNFQTLLKELFNEWKLDSDKNRIMMESYMAARNHHERTGSKMPYVWSLYEQSRKA